MADCGILWDYAEPGMLFWDRVREWNLLSEDMDFSYAGVNPCALAEVLGASKTFRKIGEP